MASLPALPLLSLLLLLLLLLISLRPNFSLSAAADVHDLLPKYGFPRGLIPSSVDSYSLSAAGDFEIHLRRPCYVQFDQLVYYDKLIKGKLAFGSVTGVSGIQAKKLFIWVPVTGIVAEPGEGMIEFRVGALSQKFPANQFEEIPNCMNKACHEESPFQSI